MHNFLRSVDEETHYKPPLADDIAGISSRSEGIKHTYPQV